MKVTKERWMHETNCSPSFWMLLAPTDKRQDHVRRTVRDLRMGVAKCTEFDGGISEHLL